MYWFRIFLYEKRIERLDKLNRMGFAPVKSVRKPIVTYIDAFQYLIDICVVVNQMLSSYFHKDFEIQRG